LNDELVTEEQVPGGGPGAAADPAARHGVAVPRGQDLLPGARGGRFGRMFPFLPWRDPGFDACEALVGFIETAGQTKSIGNPSIPAGYTYLGQFIDHDITFDPTSKLQRDNDPHALVNFRTPRFDLDSLYGSGPQDQPFLYDWTCSPHRGLKLLVDCNPIGGKRACVDLPRNSQGRALIGDARNDENLIISQLHLLFVNFHNKVVDHVAEQAQVKCEQIFDEAQRIVRWHYQWIVTHDFLKRIVGKAMARSVLRPGVHGAAPSVERRFYSWQEQPVVPVEFSGAAYRFGHSMVRDAYSINDPDLGVPAIPLVRLPGRPDTGRHLEGFRNLPAELVIDWKRFFEIAGRPIQSLRIDHRLADALFRLPGGAVLARLNLQRGRALGLPAGADVARAMSERPLTEEELKLREGMPAEALESLRRATPLWYYILHEARELGGGLHLGPVGGRIVAEVLVGLLEADPHSYLRQWPTWKPELPRARVGDFTMADLVRFTEGLPNPMNAGAADQR